MVTNRLIIAQRLAFDFRVCDSWTHELEVGLHYEPEPNVSVEDAKAMLRGYLTSIVKGDNRGIVAMNCEGYMTYRFKDGYFTCHAGLCDEYRVRELEGILHELGSGPITEPTEHWSVECNHYGDFEYTDEDGFKFELGSFWLENLGICVGWKLRSLSDDGVVKACCQGIIVTTPPNQELDLTKDVYTSLAELLTPQLEKCAVLFRELKPWIEEDHDLV